MTAPEFLTVAEVAALLRVSSRLIYKMVSDGRLDHVRVGDAIRIPRTSIDSLAR